MNNKRRYNYVGIIFIIIPIIFFYWTKSCQPNILLTDLLLGWFGSIIISIGILFLIMANRIKEDE